MVSVFVKHSKDCKSRDRHYKRCNCRKWLYNPEWKPDPRRSAKTRSWEKAERLARKYEAGEVKPKMTVPGAVKSFLSDKRQQHLADDVIKKYERELNAMAQTIPGYLSDVTLAELECFRATWPGVAITRRKRQERLSTFFNYCTRHKWVEDNMARDLSRIKVPVVPTFPLEEDQFQSLLDAIPRLGEKSRNPNKTEWRKRIHTFILTGRWTGLRIGDICKLERSRLSGDSVLLYTQKTGVPVYVPIPPQLAEDLRAVQGSNPAYFFWSGNGKLKSCIGDYQRTFNRLCELAGLEAHPHMLRDTFAVGMLLKGVPIETVSTLLGHESIKTTQKHYAPWVLARQQQLEEAVRKSWG